MLALAASMSWSGTCCLRGGVSGYTPPPGSHLLCSTGQCRSKAWPATLPSWGMSTVPQQKLCYLSHLPEMVMNTLAWAGPGGGAGVPALHPGAHAWQGAGRRGAGQAHRPVPQQLLQGGARHTHTLLPVCAPSTAGQCSGAEVPRLLSSPHACQGAGRQELWQAPPRTPQLLSTA